MHAAKYARSGLWAYSSEPGRLRFNQSWIAGVTCATPGAIAALAIGAPWAVGIIAATVVVGAWSVKRAWRLGIWASESHVLVKNYWRTHEFGWHEVTDIGVGAQTMGVLPQPAWAFRLSGRKLVRAQAMPFKRREQQREWDALVALAPGGVNLFPP
jgi:hypothetical protein